VQRTREPALKYSDGGEGPVEGEPRPESGAASSCARKTKDNSQEELSLKSFKSSFSSDLAK
jgi:hypothetical protein